MSVLERCESGFFRTYGENDPLGTHWDPIVEVRPSDEAVIIDGVARGHHETLAPGTIEGIGWVILPKVDLEVALANDLSGAGCLDLEAA